MSDTSVIRQYLLRNKHIIADILHYRNAAIIMLPITETFTAELTPPPRWYECYSGSGMWRMQIVLETWVPVPCAAGGPA